MNKGFEQITATIINPYVPIIIGTGITNIPMDKGKRLKGNFSFSYIWAVDMLSVPILDGVMVLKNEDFNPEFLEALKKEIIEDPDIYPDDDLLHINKEDIHVLKMEYRNDYVRMTGLFTIGSWDLVFLVDTIDFFPQIFSKWNSDLPIPAYYSMNKGLLDPIIDCFIDRLNEDKGKRQQRVQKRLAAARQC